MSLTAAVLDLATHLTEVSDLGYNKITVDPPQDGFAGANMTKIAWSAAQTFGVGRLTRFPQLHTGRSR